MADFPGAKSSCWAYHAGSKVQWSWTAEIGDIHGLLKCPCRICYDSRVYTGSEAEIVSLLILLNKRALPYSVITIMIQVSKIRHFGVDVAVARYDCRYWWAVWFPHEPYAVRSVPFSLSSNVQDCLVRPTMQTTWCNQKYRISLSSSIITFVWSLGRNYKCVAITSVSTSLCRMKFHFGVEL